HHLLPITSPPPLTAAVRFHSLGKILLPPDRWRSNDQPVEAFRKSPILALRQQHILIRPRPRARIATAFAPIVRAIRMQSMLASPTPRPITSRRQVRTPTPARWRRRSRRSSMPRATLHPAARFMSAVELTA